MTNELQIFTNPKFGQVRTVTLDGEPYFVANDVARMLGYKQPKDAVAKHCKHAKLLKGDGMTPLTESPHGINVIPEGDVYRLVTQSKLPQAQEVEEWIFDELLPKLREAGLFGKKIQGLTRLEYFKALVEVEEARIKAEQEKQIAIGECNETTNDFGAGPDYYKVSEIPWLYDLFNPDPRLHQIIGKKLRDISDSVGHEIKYCKKDSNSVWWRAYHIEAIAILYGQLLSDCHMLIEYRKYKSLRRSIID